VGSPGRARLPRRERLRQPAALERLFRRGQRIESGSFVLVYLAAGRRREAAFAAGRRLGGSVARNRARRRLREAYRRQLGRGAVPRQHVCFIARSGVLDVAFPELCQEMARALDRCDRTATRGAGAGGGVT
jgi:ribonuclease P protein component